jgi:hypothetical protein
MLVFQVKQFMFVGGLYNVAFYSELKNTPCTSARNLDALSFFAVISKCPMIGQLGQLLWSNRFPNELKDQKDDDRKP